MDSSNFKDFSPNELNRRLEEQYTEIARLAGGLAHEVKNPLSTIRLNMGLLEEDVEELDDSPQQRRVLKRIEIVKRETLRLEDLLNEFLNFTRTQSLELNPVDANSELKEVLEFFRPQAKATNIEILEYFANDLPTIRIDKRSFDRAILNLLLNAYQAIKGKESDDSKGEIVIRTRPCGSEVAIDLIDSGSGMSDETLQKYLTRFSQRKQAEQAWDCQLYAKLLKDMGVELPFKAKLAAERNLL